MSNFQFIQHNWPDIYKDVFQAEQNALKQARYTCILCRIVLERAVNWIYNNDPDLEMPYDNKLASLMYHEDFKNILKPSLYHEIHLIRKSGNIAAHGKRITQYQALASLKITFKFLAFLSKYYSEDDPAIPEFDEKLIPVGEEKTKGIDELQNKLDALEAQLEQERRDHIRLLEQASNNDLFKQQLEEKEQKVQARKNLREQSLGKGEITPALISEAETRKLFIDILLQEAGWDPAVPGVREFPVHGMPLTLNPSGRGEVDYVLFGDNGLPLAVVEAKRTMLSAKKGKRQAEEYANCLEKMTGQRPIIYYTNGFEHHMWDDLFYPEREVRGFYSKDELQLLIDRRKDRADIRNYPVNSEIAGRAYQYEAIKRITDAFVTRNSKSELKGKARKALLVMATGTGKTRTAAALVEVFTKCSWVKRVLFLADRNALVTQAKNAFNEHLPYLSAIDLTKEKEDDGTRVVFSTYKTILNKIDDLRSGDGRFYGVGHFDLIIIDEAHRSVYAKYKSIFDYFDSLLVGLTATPKKQVDHNTYELFDIEDDNPTFAYELSKAVEEQYLVPPKGVKVPIKFPREGIKYNDLSDREKEEYELKFGDPAEGAPEEIDSRALNEWLFNAGTVDAVLDFLMRNGIKVGGEHIGKTIIFAQNHKHAEFIEKRFNKMFPEYSGKLLRVIDNYEPKAQHLLEEFCDHYTDSNPRIAVSVDMMDTGVDAPRVVNLVFFKRVKSVTKFWQMIGRGTRLSPDLFGPGEDKREFYIFDFCENFEFFQENPEGVVATSTLTLTEHTFITKLEITQALLGEQFSDQPLQELRKYYLDQLHGQIEALDRSRFVVQKALRHVVEFASRSRWDNLSTLDVSTIIDHLSSLPDVNQNGDELAKRFDLLMLRMMLYILQGDKRVENARSRLIGIGNALMKKKNIPAIAQQEQVIIGIMEAQFWKEPSIPKLEEVRLSIRDLVKFLDRESTEPVYTNFQDEIGEADVQDHDVIGMSNGLQSYKDRVESFIRKNQHHLTISKLRSNQPITADEIQTLEDFLFDGAERGTKEQFIKEYGERPLGAFIRSIVGLDARAARDAFAHFLHQASLSPNQVKFIDTIISYLTKNGTIDKTLLFEPPFTDIHDQGPFGIFEEDQIRKVISIVDEVNGNAGTG